jgi:hypothetical protein
LGSKDRDLSDDRLIEVSDCLFGLGSKDIDLFDEDLDLFDEDLDLFDEA